MAIGATKYSQRTCGLWCARRSGTREDSVSCGYYLDHLFQNVHTPPFICRITETIGLSLYPLNFHLPAVGSPFHCSLVLVARLSYHHLEPAQPRTLMKTQGATMAASGCGPPGIQQAAPLCDARKPSVVCLTLGTETSEVGCPFIQ